MICYNIKNFHNEIQINKATSFSTPFLFFLNLLTKGHKCFRETQNCLTPALWHCQNRAHRNVKFIQALEICNTLARNWMPQQISIRTARGGKFQRRSSERVVPKLAHLPIICALRNETCSAAHHHHHCRRRSLWRGPR